MKVEIDCKRWRRGSAAQMERGYTQLLNRQGFMCCLGFVCLKLGAPEELIAHKSMPCQVPGVEPLLRELLSTGWTNSTFAQKAAMLNDSMHLTDDDRMQQLKTLGKEYGVEFTFTNIE